jgi:hypothetical protein
VVDDTSMSRGLGKTQRQILATIAAHPHEAWSVQELCGLIYPGSTEPTRAQTNATIRAIKRMTLPGRWKFGYVSRDRRRWLYDAGNLKAVSRRMWRLETFVIEVDSLMELPANLSDVWTEVTLTDLSDVSTEIILTDLPDEVEV